MAFCTDDREPEHIAEDGHINAIVRDAVSYGVAPEDALVLASYHPALWHGLDALGAIGPGYQADLLLLPDLERFVPEIVLKRGRAVDEIPPTPVPEWVTQSVRIKPVAEADFAVAWEGGPVRVIGLIPGQIVTEALVEELGDGNADPARDLAKIAVVERHLGTGRLGVGFVKGFGLQRGAFASTFSHDAHNIVVVGTSDAEMAHAVERLVELGGGLVVVDGGAVTAELPLPVAGLISDRSLREVIEASEETVRAVHALGSQVESPFQSLAFLALSVIPSLKITDRGLVDVDRFQLVPLAAPGRPAPAGRSAAPPASRR
jgi:adenine deaminase